jgi:HTH-type transcriptional regulator/antitoxin HipB
MNALLLQTPEQLSLHLKALRKARGLTQAQLAARIGIGQSRYAAIERHPLSTSTGQLLELLAALDVDLLMRPRNPRAPKRAARAGEDW